MATINITTNANQDAIIQRIIDRENARITAENTARAQQVPPLAPLPLFADVPDYVTRILIEAFKKWKAQFDREDVDALQTAWATATNTQKNNARAALGL